MKNDNGNTKSFQENTSHKLLHAKYVQIRSCVGNPTFNLLFFFFYKSQASSVRNRLMSTFSVNYFV
jgi:hypothetical protein